MTGMTAQRDGDFARPARERSADIAPTAHYTAWVWRHLGLPYAELFSTAKGAALFYGFRLSGEWIAAVLPGIPSMVDYLAQRHFAIDHALAQAAPDRVVELGAGLSRRGVTWAADHGVSYVEVDLPHMVAEKQARIPAPLRARLGGRLRHVTHDVLADDFDARLGELLEGAERPVVVAEGLLGYFPLDQRLKIVAAARRALSQAGGTFLCDLRAAEGGLAIRAGAKLVRGGIVLATKGRGAREDFRDAAHVRAFFAEAGFEGAEPLDLREVPRAPQVRSPASVWRATAPRR